METKSNYDIALKFLMLILFGFVLLTSCGKDNTPTEPDGNSQNKTGTFTDSRDNHTYKWIKIGNQIWMAENLAYTGSGIKHLTDNTQWNQNSSRDAWCFYNNQTDNGKTYGVLYQWKSAKIACPDGWHLPTDNEWSELIDYLGGEMQAGGKMKEASTSHWNSPNKDADNSSGFTGLPGGSRHYNGTFDFLNKRGYWWSATESSDNAAHYCTLYFDGEAAGRLGYVKSVGLSVRCIKD